MIDIVVQIMLYISGIFALIGSIGLIRFPDFYTRTHAATVTTIGSMSLGLLALMIWSFWSIHTIKIMIILIFNLFTNPTTTHAIAEKAFRMGIKPKKLVNDESDPKPSRRSKK
jgi:multicomponent Na+:H+ antiporter subunit G